MKVIIVKEWNERFETHETRRYTHLRWVPIPNKHDGLSFRRISIMADRSDIFAAWILIVQVASKMPRRGILMNEFGALNEQDLALMSGFPAEIFEKAIPVLTDPKIGWLDTIDEDAAKALLEHKESVSPEPKKEGETRAKHTTPSLEPETTRDERNRIERKERKECMVRPTLTEVADKFRQLGVPESEAEKFMAYHESKGWVVGRSPMKSWESACVTWKTNLNTFGQQRQTNYRRIAP